MPSTKSTGPSGTHRQAKLVARRLRDTDVQQEIDAHWRAGEKNEAAERVLEEWGRELRRLATRMVGEATAEDVIGITLFHVLERHGGAKYPNLRAALTNAVKFAAIDYLRKRRQEIELLDDGPSGFQVAVGWETPEQACLTAEESQRLTAALARLPEDGQRLVHARYYAEPPQQVDAIALAVGKSKRWVEKELTTIKRQLRVLLAMDDMDA